MSYLSAAEQERQLALLEKLNRSYLEQVGPQPQLEASIMAMEVAFRMQTGGAGGIRYREGE